MNAFSIEIPVHLETERLTLRAPRHGDGVQINEAIRESLNELKPWMPWAQEAPSVEDSETFVRQSSEAWKSRKKFHFLGFCNQKFVLSIGLEDIDWTAQELEIGYWTRTSASGKGLMTEAVRALTSFALETLQMHRLQIRCDSGNEASRRVAERVGFSLESTALKTEAWFDGTLRSEHVFALKRKNTP